MGALTTVEEGVELRVKIVPGASRDRISGLLGDSLKIQVAAPPERGKANAAVIALLAKALGISRKSLTVIAGQTSPLKIIRIVGMSAEQASSALGL